MDKFDEYLDKYCRTIYAREHEITKEDAKEHAIVKSVEYQYIHENDGKIKDDGGEDN